MNKLLNLLQHQNLVWHGSEHKQALPSLTSGYQELDHKLDGGFSQCGVVDIQTARGIGELRLLLPYMLEQQGLIAFINPPGQLCAEMLQHYGWDISQILNIFPRASNDGLWAAEQCLKSGACGTVVLWQETMEVHHIKRLQVASETGQCLLFLMRSAHQSFSSLPVSLCLALVAHEQGVGVEIRKRKGGWAQSEFTVDMTKQWPALTIEHPVYASYTPSKKVASL